MNRLTVILSIGMFLVLSLFLTACSNLESPPVPADAVEAAEAADQHTDAPPEDETLALDISGTYQIVGSNPDGSAYECLLDISANGDVFDWRWRACGEYLGIGIQQEKAVSVAWGGDDCQVFSYQRQEDGALKALWAMAGESALGIEEAKPTSSNAEEELTGTYDLTGLNPDGSTYTGEIEIVADGDVNHWVRKTDGELSGVGIWREDTISVAYGGENCSVVAYQVHDDGTLDSLWAYVGSSDMGSESVTPRDAAALMEDVSSSGSIELAAYDDGIEPRPSDGCGILPSEALSPNDSIELQVGELNRQYYLYLPADYDPKTPTSLVLSFHGYSGNAIGQQYGIGMNTQAEKYGFMIAYPEATSFSISASTSTITSWNDLSCNASPGPEGPICTADAYQYAFPPECGEPTDCNWCTCHDDLAFIEQLLDELETNFCIDRNRIYATGISNGGMFVQRLGCDMAERFAAIAPVAGTLARGFNCAPERATQISIMNIHGRQDDYVDVTGATSSDGYLYTAMSEVMKAWSAPESQGCDPETSPFPTVGDGLRGMSCSQNANCESGAEVVSCWWDAGHDWPAGDIQFGNEMIWDFFRRNAKRNE